MENDELKFVLDLLLDDDDEVISAALMEHMVLISNLIEYDNLSSKRKANIERSFGAGHLRLMQDYFWPCNKLRTDGSLLRGPVFSGEIFRRRFCISRSLFDKVFTIVVTNNEYFQKGLRPNCVGKMGLTPLQKVVAAIRQLCYGISADAVDDYVRIGEKTALNSLKQFCRAVVSKFENEYLRLPTDEDLESIENQFAAIGFPGCIGCIDCSG
ncbi:MAG: hypothetical protein AAGG81_09240 [Chlamydiota bacterium]